MVTRLEAKRVAKTLPNSKEAEPITGSRVELISFNPYNLSLEEDVLKAIRERPIGLAPYVKEDNALLSLMISGEDALSLKKLLKDA